MKKSDLKYNIAALREFKEIIGKSPFKLTADEFSDPDIFGALAYVGLKNGNKPTINREDMEKELTLKDASIILESFAEWTGLKDDDEKK